MFRDAYGRMNSKEEKSNLAEDFLKICTTDEVKMVREVVGNVLHREYV